jgi:leucyl-tRNA synthetase
MVHQAAEDNPSAEQKPEDDDNCEINTYWLTCFPPIAKTDNNAFGSRIDWRRSLLITKANPYYDAFVRWQVNKLYTLGKIKFGERYTIYSPKDGQPCMDHDRQDSEGHGPQEYTGVKLEVAQWSDAAKALGDKAGDRKVYFVAATPRSETMYSQPTASSAPRSSTVSSPPLTRRHTSVPAALSVTWLFQGVITPRGNIEQLGEIQSSSVRRSRP